MKEKIKALFVVLFLLALFAVLISCENIDVPESDSASITYVYNNGDQNKTETVYLTAFKRPDDPIKVGYKFIGWCTDPELTNFYNFSIAPTADTVLYAKWELNYEELLKDVETKASLFNVKVKAEFSKLLSKSISQGSGVIFCEKDGYYYVLTNYHVIDGDDDAISSYYVYDVYGNEYKAAKIIGDAKYDLAILAFKANKSFKLKVAYIDERMPKKNEKLICLSTPNGRFNTISLGNAVNYKEVTVDSGKGSSDVDFEVLWLDCYAEHGSSGGAILDTDLEIIGIVYAVANDQSGKFKYSLAIPAEKINEFLKIYSSLYK